MTSQSDSIFDADQQLAAGPRGWLVVLGVAGFALWHIITNVWWIEPGRWQNCIHFGGFALLAAWMTSTSSSSEPGSSAGTRTIDYKLAVNLIVGLLICLASLWIAYAENGIYERTLSKTGQSWQFTWVDKASAFLVIVGVIELTRRLTGWIIPILIILSLSYIMFLGQWLPGSFRSASLPLDDVVFRSLYNDEGMFGVITTISSANITLFMIFGAFLVISGASDFVIELSKVVAGRFRGGAALVAVISSALTGTISGSAVANTASTGVITIPLMKSNGFRPQFAAGVEASASTGGQLMPPIMGAGAFVMASYTGISYATIVAVSVLPAFLYFMSVAFIVRIEAMKYNIGSDEPEAIDMAKIRAGILNFILPLAVMTFMLISGKTPSFAASYAIATLIVVSWFTPFKMGPKNITRGLMLGMKTAVMTAILLVAVGLINNAVTTSGLANTFALMIAQWSQGSLLIALTLIAIASLVLGMGLPVTAAYIVLSILSAPALAGMLADVQIMDMLVQGISDPAVASMFMLVDSPHVAQIATGLTPQAANELLSALPFELAVVLRPQLVDEQVMLGYLLTAHLIVFWLSQDSNVTPPVCLAAFTAAGIAGSKPMRTGVEAWKIAKGLYVVPLLFAYTPLVTGSWFEKLHVAFFALFGIYAFNVLLQRYAETSLSWWKLGLILCGGIAAFIPMQSLLNILGAVVVSAAVFLGYIQSRRQNTNNA